MSILTGPEIDKRRREGSIVIRPFKPEQLNPNSYNVRLGNTLKMYSRNNSGLKTPLNAQRENSTLTLTIPKSAGYVLEPGRLYLASTIEYTETHNCVPQIQGRSSIGRLGIFVHVTAGFGDVGFCGNWTLELAVVEPVRVYAGMQIAQLIYHLPVGQIETYKGRYQNDTEPEGSKLWQSA